MEHRIAGRAGLALAVVSAATFGSSGAFATSLLDVGWSPGAAVTVRVLVAAAVLTVPALLQLRGRRQQLRAGWPTLAVYGVAAVAGAQLCYFMAIEHLSVAVALLLEYSGALLVVGWLWLRGGQRPRRLTVAGALLAVLGLVLVLDLLGDVELSLVGVLWGLGAAVGLAAYFVVSAATEDGLPPLVVACGGLGVGGTVLLAAGATGLLSFEATRADVTLLDAQVSWLVPVLGLSLVAAVVAYVTGIVAARVLGAKVASFVGLTEVLFAVGFAWLLLGEVLSPVQLVGGALVIAGIALVRLDELGPPASASATTGDTEDTGGATAPAAPVTALGRP
ncbi:MAG: FIG00761799: membrane protein [uncultured Acidimicrobiales bacterium]|uniref:FIG00761799: membrane protein n=1 Tax=uncultured Acidimicrobiales bacterium TaxID=310071 RepID=A0A6J4I0E9_9ACTN|nr:MAG: FIG00761799: membrane protein [uncultured Acidimicrobiales bacterium]